MVLALALAVGALSYLLSLSYFNEKGQLRDEISWVRQEFELSESQYTEVRLLHEAFMPVCESHCRDYIKASTFLENLLEESAGWTPELEKALEAVQTIEMECKRAFLKHGFEVAAVMTPEQGSRYLAMIKEQLNGAATEAMAHHH